MTNNTSQYQELLATLEEFHANYDNEDIRLVASDIIRLLNRDIIQLLNRGLDCGLCPHCGADLKVWHEMMHDTHKHYDNHTGKIIFEG